MQRWQHLPSLFFLSVTILAPSVLGNDLAWNINPQSGNFSEANWSQGINGIVGGMEVLSLYDSMFFDASSRVSLTNNLTDAEFTGLTFNSGASAYTIYGNSFTLFGPLANAGPNTQIIYNNFVPGSLQSAVDASGDITLAGIISGKDRGLYKTGTGRLTLSGMNTYTGPTAITKGALALGSAGSLAKSTNVFLSPGTVFDVSQVSGGFHVAAGQTVGGKGTINGPVTVDPNGRLAVTECAGAPSTLTINGDLTLKGATVLSVKPGFNGLQADVIEANTLTYGGTLVLTNRPEFQYQFDRTYTLFSATTFNGAFGGLSLQSWYDSAMRVDLSQLTNNGTIRIVGGNRQPIAANLSLTVAKNGSVSFDLAKYASDPDGDFLTFQLDQKEDEDTITFTNGVVTYRPASGVTTDRTFSYKVSDPSGFASSDPSATVTVTVTAAPTDGGNILSISGAGGPSITVAFAGIPGSIYQGQFSSDLAGWVDVGTPVAVSANGKGFFEDLSPPTGSGYYRTRWVRSGP